MSTKHALSIAYDPEIATFDLIAVQGLWADPNWTWKKRGISLLTDLLPNDMPTARILVFGPDQPPSRWRDCQYYLWRYTPALLLAFGTLAWASSRCRIIAIFLGMILALLSASLYIWKYSSLLRCTPVSETEDQSDQLLRDLAALRSKESIDRPIVLLGHSFGGLVIKQAAITARNDTRYQELSERMSAFIFVGTPHQGAGLANSSQRWWYGSSNDIRSVLQSGSEVLRTLHSEFMDLPIVARNGNVYSFHEQKGSYYGPSFLGISLISVDQDSASIPGRPCVGLDVRHSMLVKYDSRDDLNYLKILQAIKSSVTLVECV